MNPALIPGQIIDTMRNDHATSQAGKIMIKRFECLLAVYLAITVKRSQEFLLLGIDAQDRVAGLEKLLNEMGQMAKLLVAMRRVAAGQYFGHLATGQTSVSSRRRTMRGPTQTPCACSLSAISWG